MLDNFIYRKNTTDEKIIQEILVKQSYRKKKINFKVDSDDIWLDGGSHIGIFSLYATKNKAKKIYCYEPEPKNYEILTKNVAMLNSKHETELQCFNYAVNQTGGTHNFTIAPNTWRHSLMTHYKKELPVVSVNCMSLDEILSKHKDINCIKDIEGSELEILQNEHNFQNIRKLVFEYSFTKNRKMSDFFDCAKKLSKYFYVDIQKSYYNQKHQGKSGYWGGFVDTVIFCLKK